MEKNNDDLEPLFNTINKYDAFEDGPGHDINFRILDEKYLNSKFILLERYNDSWIRSMEFHTSPKYNVNKILPKYLNYKWISNRDVLIKELIKIDQITY